MCNLTCLCGHFQTFPQSAVLLTRALNRKELFCTNFNGEFVCFKLNAYMLIMTMLDSMLLAALNDELVKKIPIYISYITSLPPLPSEGSLSGTVNFTWQSLSTQLTASWALRAQRPQSKWQSWLFAPDSKCHDEVQPLQRASVDLFSKYIREEAPLWNCPHRPVIIYGQQSHLQFIYIAHICDMRS